MHMLAYSSSEQSLPLASEEGRLRPSKFHDTTIHQRSIVIIT